LRIELVDLLVEFCFAVGPSLGMLGFHLCYVRLNGRDVLVFDCVLDLRKSATEYGSSECLHAGVHWGRPVLLNFGDHRDPVWQQNFGYVIDKVAANPGVVQVHCRASGKAYGCANGQTCGTTQQANQTPKCSTGKSAEWSSVVAFLDRRSAI